MKEATATTTPGGGSGVIGTNDSGDEAKWVNSKVELFYYGSPMTTDEIRTAIGNLFGYEVTNYNGVLGSATLSTGDVVSVNTTQHRQFAVKVEGTTVDFVCMDSDSALSGLNLNVATGLPEGDYLPEAKVSGSSTDKITVASDGKYPVASTTADINLIPAYTVTFTGATATYGTSATTVTTGYYVQKGTEITFAFSDNGYFEITNGSAKNVVKKDSSDTEKVTVAGAVTVSKLNNYMTVADIEAIVNTYNPSDPKGDGSTKTTGATITKSASGLEIVLDKSVSDIATDVHDTGLVDLANKLIAGGSTVQVQFADNQSVTLSTSTLSTMVSMLKANLGSAPMGTTLTVTVSNANSGASVTYTVAISQATA